MMRGVALGLALAVVAIGGTSAAQPLEKRSPAPPGSAPAMLNPFIAFYAGFDAGSVSADLAAGDPQPLAVEGTARFVRGRIGQALVIGGEKGGMRAHYRAEDNLDLSRPGALSFWISPVRWIKPGESEKRDIMGLFVRHARNGGSFAVNRTGFSVNPPRKDHLLAGFFQLPGITQAFVEVHGTDAWRDGAWHLVVLCWSRTGFGLSIDGANFEPAEFAVPIPAESFNFPGRESEFLVGNLSAETTALDELTIYTRPLRFEEARALYGFR